MKTQDQLAQVIVELSDLYEERKKVTYKENPEIFKKVLSLMNERSKLKIQLKKEIAS